MKHTKLNYRMFGNGHPVIFIHGFLESMSMWNYLSLEETGYKIILVDIPGHGNSELSENITDPSLNLFAESIKLLAAGLELGGYDVVGHSLGGYVALELKKIDPNCQKLVLMNSNFWEDSEQKKKDRIRVAELALKAKDHFVNEAIPGLFYRHSKDDQEVVDLIQEAKQMEGDGIAFASLAMRNRKDNSELLAAKPEEFLIIHGAHDPLVGPEKLKEELGSIPVKVVILKNSGHMSHIEQPKELKEAIFNFL